MKKAISAWFGIYSNIDERMTAIRRAGFDSILLWSEDGLRLTSGTSRTVYNAAERAGLSVENAHLPFDGINCLWFDDLAGSAYETMLTGCIAECASLGVTRAVLHEQSSPTPPPINEVGLARFARLTETAERLGVTIAFENLRRPDYLDAVLKHCGGAAGVCYDSGHENCFAPGRDILTEYADRIAAIHLHDNGGVEDEHLLPFDGTIDWRRRMKALAASAYDGALSLECFRPLESTATMEEFLAEAFARACRLEAMVEGERGR